MTPIITSARAPASVSLAISTHIMSEKRILTRLFVNPLSARCRMLVLLPVLRQTNWLLK